MRKLFVALIAATSLFSLTASAELTVSAQFKISPTGLHQIVTLIQKAAQRSPEDMKQPFQAQITDNGQPTGLELSCVRHAPAEDAVGCRVVLPSQTLGGATIQVIKPVSLKQLQAQLSDILDAVQSGAMAGRTWSPFYDFGGLPGASYSCAAADDCTLTIAERYISNI